MLRLKFLLNYLKENGDILVTFIFIHAINIEWDIFLVHLLAVAVHDITKLVRKAFHLTLIPPYNQSVTKLCFLKTQ